MLKIVEGLLDYLSCKIKISYDKKHAWLGQSHLIKNLKRKFGILIQEVQSHKNTSTPKFLIIRPTEDIKKILMEDQQTYWLGIGMLLYLVKHLCPDLVNVTRELSKANDRANPAAFKELLHVMKYVLDMEMLGLNIESMGNSNEPWEVVCFSDSNYAGDLVSRRSISGFILMYGAYWSLGNQNCRKVSLFSAQRQSTLLCLRLLKR